MIMANKRSEYLVNYAKQNLKRLPIDFRKEYYESVLSHIPEVAGMPIATFIKAAIREKIERDGLDLPDVKA